MLPHCCWITVAGILFRFLVCQQRVITNPPPPSKALFGCDPRGSLLFVSELFTGSISDKVIAKQSGFYETVKQLKEAGYVLDGDAVMADKGFTIHDELKDLGLSLNIPSFAVADKQMSQANLVFTDKIPRHHIRVERLISRIKDFKILSHRIAVHLFPKRQAEPGLVCLLLFDIISGLCPEENVIRVCAVLAPVCASLPWSFYQDFSKEDTERIT